METQNQTPRSLASDLGLRCLPVPQGDNRLIWVKDFLLM